MDCIPNISVGKSKYEFRTYGMAKRPFMKSKMKTWKDKNDNNKIEIKKKAT
jgi:hypothetical protein